MKSEIIRYTDAQRRRVVAFVFACCLASTLVAMIAPIVRHAISKSDPVVLGTFRTADLVVENSTSTATMTMNTNGDSTLFSTFKGPGVAVGQNIWIGGGGQASIGDGGAHPSYGAGNVSLGVEALMDVTIGNDNTAVGDSALRDLTTGGDNTVIGRSSMQFSTTARQNTCVGVNTCELLDGAAGLGWNNQALGLDALESMTTGFRNVAIGADSMPLNVDGNSNVCIGDQACNVATTGNNTTAIGGIVLRDLTNASGNTVVGHASGGGITTGASNTILGAGVTGLATGTTAKIILADGTGTAIDQIWFSPVAPTSVSHGSLGTGSTNSVGNVTGVGANTSVVLTYSNSGFPNRSWCHATPNDHSVAPEYIEVTNSATAPTFSCFNVTTGAAANCDPFTYWCTGQ